MPALAFFASIRRRRTTAAALKVKGLCAVNASPLGLGLSSVRFFSIFGLFFLFSTSKRKRRGEEGRRLRWPPKSISGCVAKEEDEGEAKAVGDLLHRLPVESVEHSIALGPRPS